MILRFFLFFLLTLLKNRLYNGKHSGGGMWRKVYRNPITVVKGGS